MAATSLEGELKQGSAPTTVQYTYENAQSSTLSITNKEIIGIPGDSGKRIAAMVFAGEDVATRGTVAIGETCQVYIAGRIRVPKDTDVALAQGVKCYWDYSANKATNSTVADQMDDFVLGMVAKAAALADTEVLVDLNEGASAYSLGSSSSSSSSSSSTSSSSSSSSST